VGLLILVVLVTIDIYSVRLADIPKTTVEASAPKAFLPKKLEAYVEKYEAMGPHRTKVLRELVNLRGGGAGVTVRSGVIGAKHVDEKNDQEDRPFKLASGTTPGYGASG
jgi:hypothetical protein